MVAQDFRLQDFFQSLDRWGLTDILLPFLLIFVIIYAIMQKTKVLGEDKKNLNVVVALVVALLVIIPHVTGQFPPNADPVVILKNALPQVSIVLVAIVFLLVMIGVMGQDMVFLGLTAPGWITFISLLIIVFIFGGSAGWWDAGGFDTFLENTFGSEAIAVVIMLLIFGIIIAWVTSESKEKEDRSLLNRLGVDFGKLFGKK